MNIENFDLVDLMFRNKSTQYVAALGLDDEGHAITTGTVFPVVDSSLFSTHRPAGTRKQIKCSGASKLIDHLFYEDSASVYVSNETTEQVYVEFTANGETYHMLVKDEGIYFAEDEIGCRYHKLFAFLANWVFSNNRFCEILSDIAKEIKRLPSMVTGACQDLTLAFDDEFYYYGKIMTPTVEVHTGASTVLAEVQAAFRANTFIGNNRIGNYVSPFEKLNRSRIRTEVKKAEKKVSSTEKLWKDIKKGKFILDYEWPEEQKTAVIPLSFLDDFVPDENFFGMFGMFKAKLTMALKRIKSGDTEAKKRDAVNVFLIGRPGTGKTYMLHALSAAFGFPIRSVAMSKNSEEDAFEGMNKVIEGKLTEVQTPFLKNAHMGGITVIEEINLADPDVVMGAIGQYVEYPYTVFEQGYQPVKRHPLNIVCGTMNIGTAGSKEVSEALSSRFPASYILDDPKREDFIARLMMDGYSKEACTYVYDIYSDILDTLKSPDYNCEDYCLAVTFRSCHGALQCMEMGDDSKKAIYHTMIGKIAEKDMDIADRIWQEVVEPKPDFGMELFA